MSKGKKKAIFEVQDNETIDMCLDRMNKAGFFPIKRTEKPIFQEIEKDGEITYEPAGRKIIFEAVAVD